MHIVGRRVKGPLQWVRRSLGRPCIRMREGGSIRRAECPRSLAVGYGLIGLPTGARAASAALLERLNGVVRLNGSSLPGAAPMPSAHWVTIHGFTRSRTPWV
jgi:hypothetical protein